MRSCGPQCGPVMSHQVQTSHTHHSAPADGGVSIRTRFVEQSQALWKAVNQRSILLPALFVFLWQVPSPALRLHCRMPGALKPHRLGAESCICC